ncbi:MAG: LysR family transcriptional regulator [Bdellovibrionota bacterium]
MDKFVVSSDDCLILKALKDSKSLREAAQLLGCDPAGLARRVQHISSKHGFVQKVNNRWQITSRGMDLVAWTESSILSQKKIFSSNDSLRIASTMWFGEEVLIPNLSKLKDFFNEDISVSLSVPDEGFELSLVSGNVDFVVACHPPENPEIAHKQITEEKWILIAPVSWKKNIKSKSENILEFLKDKPFISHRDINVDLFLSGAAIKKSDISINNLIGIRSAVCANLGWSLVPKILVDRHLKNNELIEIPYEIPTQDRKVCVWWLRNRDGLKRQSSKISSWIEEVCP